MILIWNVNNFELSEKFDPYRDSLHTIELNASTQTSFAIERDNFYRDSF